MASLAKPGLDKLEAYDAPRYGLLSAVRFRENPPLGWESSGVQAELAIKGPVKAWAVDPATCTWDTANPKSDKTVTTQDNGADVLPITLSATHECTPTGVSFGESEALALELLNRHAEPSLEKAYKNLWVDSHGFWTLELPPATPELSVQTVTKEQVEFIIQALEIQSILQNEGAANPQRQGRHPTHRQRLPRHPRSRVRAGNPHGSKRPHLRHTGHAVGIQDPANCSTIQRNL